MLEQEFESLVQNAKEQGYKVINSDKGTIQNLESMTLHLLRTLNPDSESPTIDNTVTNCVTNTVVEGDSTISVTMLTTITNYDRNGVISTVVTTTHIETITTTTHVVEEENNNYSITIEPEDEGYDGFSVEIPGIAINPNEFASQ